MQTNHNQDQAAYANTHGVSVLPNIRNKLALAVIAALLFHHVVFKIGEWHFHSPHIFLSHLLAFTFYTAYPIFANGCGIGAFILEAVCVFGGYMSCLLMSIILYRSFWHFLSMAEFTGPRMVKVRKLWYAWKCRDARNHLLLDRLAEEYGDVVRTGR